MSSSAQTTRLTRYEILRYLGHGGMAEVLLARAIGPEGFEKLVVLKKIIPQLATDARHVRLFLDEARLAACLDHPNIVHVHDLGLVDTDYCYAMEFVHGESLSRVLERAELPVGLAIQVATSLASALHYAHQRRGHDGRPLGIVHRDVSPSNILVSYDGVVKLIDFGIAKAANSSIRTMTGVVKGKPGYVAPEQAGKSAIDHRADVFALGAVLWEMLTGLPLHDTTPTPPSQLRPECPRELDGIVLRALAPSPDERYQTAQQLQRALDGLARQHRLDQSSLALADHMRDCFASELRAWQVPETSVVTRTDLAVRAAPAASDDVEEPTRSFEAEPATVSVATSVATRPYRTTKRIDTPRTRHLATLFVLLAIACALVARPLLAKRLATGSTEHVRTP